MHHALAACSGIIIKPSTINNFVGIFGQEGMEEGARDSESVYLRHHSRRQHQPAASVAARRHQGLPVQAQVCTLFIAGFRLN